MIETKPELRQVMTYVDIETFYKLERVRKRTSRSAFVANILEEVFSHVELVEGNKL